METKNEPPERIEMNENKRIRSFTLLNTRDQNSYFFEGIKKRFHLCHPLLYHVVKAANDGDDKEWKNMMNAERFEIANRGSFSKAELEYYCQKYLLLKNNGYFSGIDLVEKLSKKVDAKTIEENIANVKEVVFSVTNRCNMDCHYCGYGKLYETSDNRGKKDMDMQTAVRFLDYLTGKWNSPLNKSQEQSITVGFYGGEPLLNFPLIEKIVDYVKRIKLKHNYFKFLMTTNGTLLKEHIDFLYKNNFDLLISLDGSEDNNGYRVFKNGRPAYHTILENVAALKQKYPGYFDAHVNFLSVLHNKNSVSDIYNYFKNFHNKKSHIDGLKSLGIKESQKEEFWRLYHNFEQSLHESEDYSLIAKDLFTTLPNVNDVIYLFCRTNEFFFLDYNNLIYEEKGRKRFPTATCFPFDQRVFLNEYGEILPCERSGFQFELGYVTPDNVDLDVERIAKLYNDYYDKVRKICCKCYNADICKSCMFYLKVSDQDEVVKCHGFMDEEKHSQYLSSFVSYIENNPKTFTDYLKGSRSEELKKQIYTGKDYWFLIEPYVHISIKNDSLLLYNSLTGEALLYDREKPVIDLVRQMLAPQNQQVVLLKKESLEHPTISRFVSDTRKYFMGDIIDTSYSKGKPIQMMPVVSIGRDVKFLKTNPWLSVGENVLSYLTEIFLYINNKCNQKCLICGHAYKQFPCCTIKQDNKGEADLSKIKGLLDEVMGSQLSNLNILGGNIFAYSKFIELAGLINHLPAQKTYYTHYANILEENGKLKYLNPKSSVLKVLAPAPLDQDKLTKAVDYLKKTGIESQFIFVVQNEEEFNKAETVISALKIDNSDYQPFYNGNNLEFFEKNVFTTEEEILAAKPTMKNIFTNSVVNKLNFGRLTILSNGYIYANVNAHRLGVLGKDSVYDALYKEMYHGKSWRRIRKNVQPCKHCTFQALCPPLSNYNYALGKNNLCQVMKESV